MYRLPRTTLLPIAALLLLNTSCTFIKDATRPAQHDASKTLGDATCTPDLLTAPNGAQRFVVEWNDGDRASLEEEMEDGVALIKYTCDGMQVLRSCAVPGTYGYRASNSKKTRTLQINDAITASANFSTPTPGASLKSVLEQGRSLNLAYVMIGSRTTPVKDVSREQLDRAACQEATHFVYQSQVGAFAMETGEKGEALVAGKILGLGKTDNSASSSRQSLSADGEAEACQQATPGDANPPQGCGALMRVSIIPLINGKIPGFTTEDTSKTVYKTYECPPGTVLSDGVCATPTKATSQTCKTGDLNGCKTSCEDGDMPSCNRMAQAFSQSMPNNLYPLLHERDSVSKANLKTFEQLKEDTIDDLEEACLDDDLPDACWLLGTMIVDDINQDRDSVYQDEDAVEYITDTIKIFHNACKFGNPAACSVLIDTTYDLIVNFQQQDYQKHHPKLNSLKWLHDSADKSLVIMKESCFAGTASVCLDLATASMQLGYKKTSTADALGSACQAGLAEGCFWASMMHATQDESSCTTLLERALRHKPLETTKDLLVSTYDLHIPGAEYLNDKNSMTTYLPNTCSLLAGSNRLAPYNPKLAQQFSQHACHLDGKLAENACVISQ